MSAKEDNGNEPTPTEQDETISLLATLFKAYGVADRITYTDSEGKKQVVE